MKTTNHAFIEAYRQAEGEAPTAAAPAAVGSTAPPWQNVEVATWHLPATESPSNAPTIPTESGWARVDSAHTDGPHFDTPQSRRMKRRLSDIAAERDRLEQSEPVSSLPEEKASRPATAAIEWPELCAELLVMAAAQYDEALRSLCSTHDGTLLLGVLSSRPKTGCTTAAICLALRAATLGLRPLLLEATSASLADQLGMSTKTGWWPLTVRRESPLRAAHFDARSGVAVLPSGDALPDEIEPAELFELASAIGTLRQKHRIVIVDLGAVDTPTSAARTTRLSSAMGIDRLIALTDGGEHEIDVLQSRLGHCANRLAGVLGVAQNS